MYLSHQQTHLTIQDSIVDGHLGGAIVPQEDMEAPTELTTRVAIAANPAGTAPGPTMTLNRTTIFGLVNLHELAASSNVLFTNPVQV